MRRTLRLLPLALLLLALPAGGCDVFGGDAAPTATPTLTPTATLTRTPTLSPTPTPQPEIESGVLSVVQGGYAVLRVRGLAVSGLARFEGRDYPLVPRQSGFWTVIGLAADKPTGTYPLAVTLFDRSGAVTAELSGSVSVVSAGYGVEQIFVPPGQSALLDPALTAQEQAIRDSVFSAFAYEQFWSGAFVMPVPGPISSPYGIGRSYNGGPVSGFHHGTDFPVDEGTPVIASASGRVAFAGELPVRGLSVIIDHGLGVFSGYHHLSRLAVTEGETIAVADLVGYSGASGLATGPHLHWEVIVRGVEVDPVLWTYEIVGP
jgi:hypothetical protein